MITQVFCMRRAVAMGVALALAGGSAAYAEEETVPTQAPQTSQAPSGTALVATPLSAEAQAMKSALERKLGGNSTALGAYAAKGFEPLWLDADGKANAAATDLVETLQRAGDHGLPEQKYGGAGLAARLGAAGGAALEADLTHAFLTYARDIGAGILEPRSVDRELHIYPEPADEGDLIGRARNATDMAAYLISLEPQDPVYRRLVERFAAFRSSSASNMWGEAVAKGRTMRPGERSQRVAQVRARLTAMGDLDPNVYDTPTAAATAADGTQVATADIQTDAPVLAYDPTLFDNRMVEALQSFQSRHGLNLDGVIGPATLRQINVSPSTRAEQIAVNLERMRWMNRDLGSKHILVNLAGFTMDVMNKGRSEFSQRVVIGKAKKHRTPEFSDEMDHMVVNPSWYVPTSIAREEILPKLEHDPDYLAKRGMRMVNGRIIQRPGRGNALGTVKFMFPNKFAIYLHDTPSKRLFKRDVRAYSHGCVRVERPHEFAAYLLTAQQDDPAGYFQSLLQRGRERRVNLDDPLPVHITYRSAWIDENGVEQFRGDIYGRDRKIADALTRSGVTIFR